MISNERPLHKTIGWWGGVILFLLILYLPAPEYLSEGGWKTAAVALLMGTWWITEAIPISATALLPIFLLPVMNIVPIGDATAPYANPLIFLFLGGFILAVGMEQWGLHRRIALTIVRYVGTEPRSIIMGFILASAFLSMWVSNTATALLMLPIATSVLQLADRRYEDHPGKHNFELVLLLSIAYACNIGGMGTLIGTPPNALLAGFMNENYAMDIGFARWLTIGLPLVVITLPLMYFVLTNFIYPVRLQELPGGTAFINDQFKQLGPFSTPEKRVAVVFGLTALLWITRPLLDNIITGLSDSGIAIGASLTLFMIPAGRAADRARLLSWRDLDRLPWGVLILFGGGLSLASAISTTGLAEWIGGRVEGLHAWPLLLLVLLVVTIIVLLTEMTSNTATTAAFLPVLASVAVGVGQDPLLLAVPATLAASCAFMLPVATPPNAIIYGSDRLNIPEMAKAGIWLNIIFILLIGTLSFTLLKWIFNLG